MEANSKNKEVLREKIKKIIKRNPNRKLVIVNRVTTPLKTSPLSDNSALETSVVKSLSRDRVLEVPFTENNKFDEIDLDSFKKMDTDHETSSYTYNYENTKYTPDFNTDLSQLDALSTLSKPVSIYNTCYKINFDVVKPYLLFYLYKYPKSDKPSSDMMMFPFETYKNKPDNTIYKQSLALLNKIFGRTQRDLIDKTPKGFIYNKEMNYVYIFYEYDHNADIEPDKLMRKTPFWWCLIDELVNYKKVTNFPVNNTVYNLFIDNPSLLYLRNQGEIIEVPSVGYHGTFYELMEIIVKTGLRNSTLNPMMGPYYYFGTFRKAVRYAGWTSTYKPRKIRDRFIADKNGLYEKGGIIRFVVFLGRMKAFLNHKDDPLDKSSRYYNRLKEGSSYKDAYENRVLRLHDHDGKWASEDNYDSVYLGRAMLDNGKLFMKNPEFVVKRDEQHTLLSYHQLDKNTLDKDTRTREYKWNPNYNKYNIY